MPKASSHVARPQTCGPLEYAHVEKVSESRPDGDWWAEWEQGGVRYRLRFKGAPGTVVYTAVGPGGTRPTGCRWLSSAGTARTRSSIACMSSAETP